MEQSELFFGETYDRTVDFDRLKNNTQRVFALLLDEKWHDADELRAIGGSEALRRARSLREAALGGFDVQSRREDSQRGVWQYRMDLTGVPDTKVERVLRWGFDRPTGEDSEARTTRGRIKKRLKSLTIDQLDALEDVLDRMGAL